MQQQELARKLVRDLISSLNVDDVREKAFRYKDVEEVFFSVESFPGGPPLMFNDYLKSIVLSGPDPIFRKNIITLICQTSSITRSDGVDKAFKNDGLRDRFFSILLEYGSSNSDDKVVVENLQNALNGSVESTPRTHSNHSVSPENDNDHRHNVYEDIKGDGGLSHDIFAQSNDSESGNKDESSSSTTATSDGDDDEKSGSEEHYDLLFDNDPEAREEKKESDTDGSDDESIGKNTGDDHVGRFLRLASVSKAALVATTMLNSIGLKPASMIHSPVQSSESVASPLPMNSSTEKRLSSTVLLAAAAAAATRKSALAEDESDDDNDENFVDEKVPSQIVNVNEKTSRTNDKRRTSIDDQNLFEKFVSHASVSRATLLVRKSSINEFQQEKSPLENDDKAGEEATLGKNLNQNPNDVAVAATPDRIIKCVDADVNGIKGPITYDEDFEMASPTLVVRSSSLANRLLPSEVIHEPAVNLTKDDDKPRKSVNENSNPNKSPHTELMKIDAAVPTESTKEDKESTLSLVVVRSNLIREPNEPCLIRGKIMPKKMFGDEVVAARSMRNKLEDLVTVLPRPVFDSKRHPRSAVSGFTVSGGLETKQMAVDDPFSDTIRAHNRLLELLHEKAEDACKLISDAESLWIEKLKVSLSIKLGALKIRHENELSELNRSFQQQGPHPHLVTLLDRKVVTANTPLAQRTSDAITQEEYDYAAKKVSAQELHCKTRITVLRCRLAERQASERTLMQSSSDVPIFRLERLRETQLELVSLTMAQVSAAVAHCARVGASVRGRPCPVAQVCSLS